MHPEKLRYRMQKY
ncbi:MAG: hypothetical protein F4Z85_14740, partial [Gemmatimonadetes bacterium]|nr:hypothetical protein [Gemmatimonadota bacterium]